MANKVYVTGAGGRLGRAVFAKIKGAVPLVRRKSGLEGEIVSDFSPDSLREALKDASAVIHIAGSVDTLDRKGLHDSNVELTRKVVEAAPPGCRIILASSVSVYGKLLKKIPADEDTPVGPDSDYSRSKLEAEGIVRARPDHVILRIGTIYGPGFEDYDRILGKLEAGKMRLIGRGGNRIPFVHVDDVADAFRAALTKGSGVYVIAGNPLTQKEIYGIAARELGVRAPERKVDRRSAILLAAFGEIGYRLGMGRPSLTREHVAVLAYDREFDCSRARRELGFAPRPLEEGIKQMVKGYLKRRNKN